MAVCLLWSIKICIKSFLLPGGHIKTQLQKAGTEEVINIRPHICTDSAEELPVCDIIIISVKSYDLKNAVDALNKLAGSNTVILQLLNGVDIHERIRKYLKTAKVLKSCIYVGTHIESPGIIYQKGGSCIQ